MNVLILGSGGREHALAWKVSQSSSCNKLFIAPGNAGTTKVGQNVNINVTDFNKIKEFVIVEKIEMVIVGPEDPLVLGIFDFFQSDEEIRHVSVIGPSKQGALLEGSKDFAKEFMIKNNIPTAKHQTFTKENIKEGYAFFNNKVFNFFKVCYINLNILTDLTCPGVARSNKKLVARATLRHFPC